MLKAHRIQQIERLLLIFKQLGLNIKFGTETEVHLAVGDDVIDPETLMEEAYAHAKSSEDFLAAIIDKVPATLTIEDFESLEAFKAVMHEKDHFMTRYKPGDAEHDIRITSFFLHAIMASEGQVNLDRVYQECDCILDYDHFTNRTYDVLHVEFTTMPSDVLTGFEESRVISANAVEAARFAGLELVESRKSGVVHNKHLSFSVNRGSDESLTYYDFGIREGSQGYHSNMFTWSAVEAFARSMAKNYVHNEFDWIGVAVDKKHNGHLRIRHNRLETTILVDDGDLEGTTLLALSSTLEAIEGITGRDFKFGSKIAPLTEEELEKLREHVVPLEIGLIEKFDDQREFDGHLVSPTLDKYVGRASLVAH